MDTNIYKIQTEFFEGPLDLLLHLIRKNKMNIMDIKISEITAEYLSYIKNNSSLNPSREGEFLMTASTLIYIKSRSLLPRPEIMDEESPEEKLRNTLIEYDKIQKISKILKEMESQEILLWRREVISESFETKEFTIGEVSAFQLAELFLNIIKRKEREEFLYLESKNYSIESKMGEILELLNKEDYLNFTEYIESLDSLEEILVSFFTLLELAKQKIVFAVQKQLFDTISVWKGSREYLKDV
jgi:segregation and condensation protein A